MHGVLQHGGYSTPLFVDKKPHNLLRVSNFGNWGALSESLGRFLESRFFITTKQMSKKLTLSRVQFLMMKFLIKKRGCIQNQRVPEACQADRLTHNMSTWPNRLDQITNHWLCIDDYKKDSPGIFNLQTTRRNRFSTLISQINSGGSNHP